MTDDPHDWPDDAEAALEAGVLTGRVEAPRNAFPPCPDHKEVQHRDGKPPWCNRCGWTHGADRTAPKRLGRPNGGWGTPRLNDG